MKKTILSAIIGSFLLSSSAFAVETQITTEDSVKFFSSTDFAEAVKPVFETTSFRTVKKEGIVYGRVNVNSKVYTTFLKERFGEDLSKVEQIDKDMAVFDFTPILGSKFKEVVCAIDGVSEHLKDKKRLAVDFDIEEEEISASAMLDEGSCK